MNLTTFAGQNWLITPAASRSLCFYAEILADIPLGWLRTIAGTPAQSAAAF
jgi:hypothetical protein